MAMHDEVLREILAGRISWRFKTRDLKRIPGSRAGYFVLGSREYSENAINSIPRNHSIRPDGTDPGDYVQKGRKPAFLYHGNGEYELILTHGHHLSTASPEGEGFDAVEGDDETLISTDALSPHGSSPFIEVDTLWRMTASSSA